MRDVGTACASAPARVCLAGESLDWMTGGSSVCAAINLPTDVIATVDRRRREVFLSAGAPLNVNRVVPVARLDQLTGDTLDYLQVCAAQILTGGGEVTSQTAAPVGAGVSSSAAVTVAATAALLAAVEGVAPDVHRVVELAYSAEVRGGSGAGRMDFLAVAHGGVRRIDSSTPPSTRLLASGFTVPVVLIDTMQRRTTKRALVSKRQRWHDRDPLMGAYADRAPVLVEAITAALTAPCIDYPHVGALLTEGHRLLAECMLCSTPLLDKCVTTCLNAGAYGAKLTGSGHGGCCFALVSPDHLDEVAGALADLPVEIGVTETDARGVTCTLLS